MSDASKPYLAIQVPMMPHHANGHPTLGMLPNGERFTLYSTIFGGVLLSYIDLAGAVTAQRELQLRGGNPKASFVTVAINKVEFRQPVLVGDVVRFETSVIRIGRTSMTIRIDVHAERGTEDIHVTEAEGTFVGVDLSTPERKPVPLFPEVT
ncbi:MAG: acyl-CoA thioesterase [Planctomycetes bacterium]|nr:acyl-CoA thioesterase [Planctomycetota bacterium]